VTTIPVNGLIWSGDGVGTLVGVGGNAVNVGIKVGLGVGEGSSMVTCGWNEAVGWGFADVVGELHPEMNSNTTANTATTIVGRGDIRNKNLLQAISLNKHRYYREPHVLAYSDIDSAEAKVASAL
jgi:hypothetical protein